MQLIFKWNYGIILIIYEIPKQNINFTPSKMNHESFLIENQK